MTSGDLSFDLDDGTADGQIVIDARGAGTGNGARARKMHRAVLESALFPDTTFRPRNVRGTLAPDGTGHLSFDGDLTVHGRAHPVTLETDVEIDVDGRAIGTAALEAPYVAWGMKDPSLFLVRVAKQVEVTVHAVGRVESAPSAVTTAHHR